jgi:hypothetical protein
MSGSGLFQRRAAQHGGSAHKPVSVTPDSGTAQTGTAKSRRPGP